MAQIIRVYALVDKHGEVHDAYKGKEMARNRAEYLKDQEEYKVKNKKMRRKDMKSPFNIVRCKGVFNAEEV